jgi:ABC-2 type transport system permease protein
MNAITTIAFSEFQRLFRSPLAWSLLAIVQFILAWMFLNSVEEYLIYIQPKLVGLDNAPGVTEIIVSNLYSSIAVIMLAIMPILTMRLFAEERMNGTLTLLLSSPISASQIVLGKYLGLMLFVLLMIAMLSLMPFSLFLGTQLDIGVLFASILGLTLLLASFAAAGLFLSSLTKQAGIAAISSFGLLLFLVILYISGSSQSGNSSIFIYLSHFGHFLSFLQGTFDSSDLIYYLLFSLGFLLLTIRKLNNDRLHGG